VKPGGERDTTILLGIEKILVFTATVNNILTRGVKEIAEKLLNPL
jgi:hypothetical protein